MAFDKLTVRDVAAQLKDQVVLVRADYNVSLQNGQVMDDLRLRASLPTLEFLRQAGAAKIIVMSHLGRPKGQRQADLSLAPVATELKKLLPATYVVNFVDEVYGEKVSAAVRDLPTGGILLLENLRFWPEEEANDVAFAQKIVAATGATWFVQDGFAQVAVHQQHLAAGLGHGYRQVHRHAALAVAGNGAGDDDFFVVPVQRHKPQVGAQGLIGLLVLEGGVFGNDLKFPVDFGM